MHRMVGLFLTVQILIFVSNTYLILAKLYATLIMNHSEPILKVDQLSKYYGHPCERFAAGDCSHPRLNNCDVCGCLFAAMPSLFH